MKPRINMITLGVKDMEKAIQFYANGLGLPRMPFAGATSGDIERMGGQSDSAWYCV